MQTTTGAPRLLFPSPIGGKAGAKVL